MKRKNIEIIGRCFIVFFAVALIAGNSSLIFGQQKKNYSRKNKVQLKEKKETTSNNNQRQYSADSKESTSKIVSIRQINLIVDDYKEDGTYFQNQKKYIEIRLFSKVPRPTNIGNQRLLVNIGDKSFLSFGIGRIKDFEITLNDILVTLTPEEFESLTDDSIVSFSLAENFDEARLKEIYEKGEPKEIRDQIFGRLNKKMIDDFPPIERFNRQQ